MRIFFICKVRGVVEGDEEWLAQKAYVELLERRGDEVHWPHRDTNQKDSGHGTGICRTTFWAIYFAKEVHVRFDPTSEGYLADMMMTFALNELRKIPLVAPLLGRRKVVIVNSEAVDRKIQEQVAEQVAGGIDPAFAKSYVMVLKNLADETAEL